MSRNKSFLQRQWFIIALIGLLILGLSFPSLFKPVATWRLARNLVVATVLFLTSLPLETKSIKQTLRRPAAAILAVFINFGVLPAVAIVLAKFMSREWATGFIVMAAAPCTVASAAVWTRRAGGNDVVAIMTTVITNGLCFVITPLWLTQIAGANDVSISAVGMIKKLALLVFLPMLLGQLLRMNAKVAAWSTSNKAVLGTLAQIGLLGIVFVGAIHCGLRLQNTDLSGTNFYQGFVVMLIAAAVLHTSMLFLGQSLGRFIGLGRPEWIAVGFAGSQKTLMIGLQIALMVGGGLTILPMVAYHMIQLLIDTVVADRLAAEQ